MLLLKSLDTPLFKSYTKKAGLSPRLVNQPVNLSRLRPCLNSWRQVAELTENFTLWKLLSFRNSQNQVFLNSQA